MNGTIARVTVLAAASAAGAAAAPPAARVTLEPAVVRPGRTATIAVTGVGGTTMFARLGGASTRSGGQARWIRLRLVGGAWRGALPAPALGGIYPVRLRDAHGTAIPLRGARLLRVYTRATAGEPSFADVRAVIRWWASSRGVTLTASRPWRLSDVDRRDRRLHRLFVVAYRRPGRPTLGLFLTAVRDGYGARWRFLTATVEPPGVVPRGAPA